MRILQLPLKILYQIIDKVCSLRHIRSQVLFLN